MNNIENLRTKFKKEYSFELNKNLFFVVAGTATGKTRTIANNYFDYIQSNKIFTLNQDISTDYTDQETFNNNYHLVKSITPFHNFIFLFPLKNIFYVDREHQKTLREKGVPLLWIKPNEDLISTDSLVFFFTEKLENNKEPSYIQNKDYFSFIQKLINNQKIASYIEQITKDFVDTHNQETNNSSHHKQYHENSFLNFFQLFNRYKEMKEFIQNSDKSTIYSSEELDLLKKRLLSTHYSVCQFYLTIFPDSFIKESIALALSLPIDINQAKKITKDISKDKDKLTKIAFGLFFLHSTPFEVMKHFNCSTRVTVHKSIYNGFFSDKHPKNNTKKIYFDTLFNITSDFKQSNYSRMGELLRCKEAGLQAFLENDFYQPQENYFKKNNITFTIAIDECDKSYDILLENNSIVEFNKNKNYLEEDTSVNILQALSGIARWINDSKNLKNNIITNNKSFEESKADFTRNLLNSYQHIGFSSQEELEDFISCFLANEYDLQILNEDIDLYNNLFKNITMLTPKVILNKEVIENTKLYFNNNYIILSESELDTDKKPYNVLLFINLIIMCIYYLKDMSEEHISKDKTKQSQNEATYLLTSLSTKNKQSLDDIYNSTFKLEENSDFHINTLFTYFVHKSLFNIHLARDSATHKNAASAYLNLSFIKPLPEVDILKNLYRPGNKVFLISATQLYNNSFSSEFYYEFFSYIESQGDKNVRIHKSKYNNSAAAEISTVIFNEIKKTINYHDITFNYFQEDEDGLVIHDTKYMVNNIDFLNKENQVTTKKSTLNINDDHCFKNMISVFEDLHIPEKGHYDNIFRIQELERLKIAIIHAIINNKDSIVFGFSNVLIYTLREEMRRDYSNLNQFFKIKDSNHRPSDSYFENKDFRFILYDSHFNKTNNLDQLLIPANKNQKIIILTSFNSAGLGVNLTVNREETIEDFQSIYIADTPFYSPIKDKQGYNNINAILSSLKYITHNLSILLSKATEVINSPYINSKLREQHTLLVFKTLHQSIGRINRTLSLTESHVYLINDDLNNNFNNFIEHNFYILNKHNPNRDIAILNSSAISKSALILSRCCMKNKTMNTEDKNNLKKISQKAYFEYENNTNLLFSDPMFYHRTGNQEYSWIKDLNVIFREYTQPDYSLVSKLKEFINTHSTQLKKLKHEKANKTYEKIIEDIMYNIIINNPTHNNLIVTLNSDYKNSDYKSRVYYSDVTERGSLYDLNFIFNLFYNSQDDSFFYLSRSDNSFYNFNSYYFKQNIKKYPTNYKQLINPGVISLIRGNLGESFFLTFIEHINKNTKKQIINISNNHNMQPIYEFFDFYYQINNRILCIDIKNFNPYSHKNVIKTANSVKRKVDNTREILQKIYKNHTFEFYYINTNPAIKSVDGKNIIYSQNGSQYLNLFATHNPLSENQNNQHAIIINPQMKNILL